MQITVTVFVTRDEINDWLARQTRRFELHFALVRHRPQFEVVPLAGWDEFGHQKDADHWREIWIDLQPIRHDCQGQLDCCSKNVNRLAFDLPEVSPMGLREGNLGTLSDEQDHLRVWRSIIRFFRNQTTSGMWALAPESRARKFYKHLRYSSGVAELHRQGLSLLPLAGSCQIFIEEPV